MMKEPEAPPLPPFAGFRVETEKKADGRLVRYFSWTSEAATAGPATGSEATGAAGGGDPEGVDDQFAAHGDRSPGPRAAGTDAAPSGDEERAGV